jgi:hypothetical protein
MKLKHRGAWRKLFGLRGDLWCFESQKQQRVADKPHPITILIGLISPALAITATIISVLSLRTSQESLRIGQRAYLSFQIRKAEAKPEQKEGTHVVHFSPTLSIKNLGNTPATVLGVVEETQIFTNYTYKHLGASGSGPSLGGGIGPKDDATFDANGQSLSFDPSVPQNRLIRFVGYVHWADVFGTSHLDTWCFLFWDQDIKTFADTNHRPNSDNGQRLPRFTACPHGPPPTKSADPRELDRWLNEM